MRKRASKMMCLLAAIAIASLTSPASLTGAAQEGHPLTGTWSGDWGTTPSQRNHVTLVLNWDGDKVSGTMNPGPDAVTIPDVFVDYANWTVRIEGDMKGQGGAPAHFVAEGKLEDIGSYHRTVSGTWTQGTTKGNFKITRD